MNNEEPEIFLNQEVNDICQSLVALEDRLKAISPTATYCIHFAILELKKGNFKTHQQHKLN